MTSTSDFPEMDAVLSNHALFEAPQPIPVHALPDRQYLEHTVLPLLLHGLEATVRERPNDPIEFLAAYLISNNPQRDDVLPQPVHPMLYGAGLAVVNAVQALNQVRADLSAEKGTLDAAVSSPSPSTASPPASKK